MSDFSGSCRAVGAALLALLTAVGVVWPAIPAGALPVPQDPAAYEVCGRVFPDPHAYWPAPAPLPQQSPFAKGNAACRAVDFLGWDETISGLRLLEELLPHYVEVYDLSDPDGPLADALDLEVGEGSSAGLPTTDLGRDRAPMYLVRVTDEQDDTIAIEDREHFVFGLSIHGIERAGVEGGVRAAEDLATWAACEADEEALPTCDLNGPFPHPILETAADSTTAGEALRTSSVWFVLNNPDGWRRGDKQAGGFFYQRYNGNGMDLNRDWPNEGFTFRPFTPFSEPETRGVAKALQAIKGKWTGGIDLHGQLIDRAFSFTLIGGNQRPFDKDRRVMQFVKGAWADAEERLSWSPSIKGNDEPEACVPPGASGVVNEPPCDPLPRMYGVQWGTIWDTIAYTTPGAFGDWVDSPLGLDADGIDNEMSVSHLSNCGVGTCYLTEFEQLHVDGNKSLIYSMIHYSLVPEDTGFRYAGRAGWLHHDRRVRHDGSPLSTREPSGLPVQDPISVDLLQPAQSSHEFDVLGPSGGVENGGMHATFTGPNLQGVSALAVQSLSVDRLVDGEWEVVNSYYNQAPTYLQAGARIDVNLPEPGRYRVTASGEGVGPLHVEVTFTDGPSWPDPGQRAFDVSNLDFFRDLQ
ncbi:MAG: M14 family zinc carboxypeptidase, partial [Acidimicrobiales bacterium]